MVVTYYFVFTSSLSLKQKVQLLEKTCLFSCLHFWTTLPWTICTVQANCAHFSSIHLNGGGWYLDCIISFIHLSEVDLRISLEELGAIDLEVDEFWGMTNG